MPACMTAVVTAKVAHLKLEVSTGLLPAKGGGSK